MQEFISPIANLIDEFARLPSIGRKTAQRLAFHVLKLDDDAVAKLARTLIEAKSSVRYCSICGNFTDIDPCRICSNPNRDKKIICVVEDSKDIFVMEKTREFKGLYHVLQGAISPMDGIGPNDIKIKELLKRLNDDVQEIIIATNATVEGDATAMYISKLIKPLGIMVTRIANGVPVGGDIEYADELSLSKALELRREI